uniref:Uncharacterized protein n=1 Tax=Dunaliella tertiolecta TaxID=3047 RepID=A0A7S3R6A7_DUNTE
MPQQHMPGNMPHEPLRSPSAQPSSTSPRTSADPALETSSAWRDQLLHHSPNALPMSLALNLRPGLLSGSGGARRVSTGGVRTQQTPTNLQHVLSQAAAPAATSRQHTSTKSPRPSLVGLELAPDAFPGPVPSPSRAGGQQHPPDEGSPGQRLLSPDSSYSARHLAYLQHQKSGKSPAQAPHSPSQTGGRATTDTPTKAGAATSAVASARLAGGDAGLASRMQQQQQQEHVAASLLSSKPPTVPLSMSAGSSSTMLQAISKPQGSAAAAAEDRRELLRMYKAAKEAKMLASRPAPSHSQASAGADQVAGGTSRSSGPRSGSMTARPGRTAPPIPANVRLHGGSMGGGSRAGLPRPVAAPPVSKAAMGRAVAAPLPPDSDVGWEDGSEAGAPHQPRLSSAPSARSSAGNHGRAGDPFGSDRLQPGMNGGLSNRSNMSTSNRSSGIFAVAPSNAPKASSSSGGSGAPNGVPSPTHSAGRAGSVASTSVSQATSLGGLGPGGGSHLVGRGGLSSGGVRGTAGGAGGGAAVYGGVGSVVVVNGGGLLTHAASLELRAEMRQLRLQELQWRFINAKVAHALQARQLKSERALAACALAITDLQSRAAVLAAQHARTELVGRAEHASSVLREPLDAWQEMEEPQQGAMQPTIRALQDSLTHVPLVGGAHCGSIHQLDLARLQDVMDRGLFVLQLMASALEPLLTAAASHPSAYTAASGTRMSRGSRMSESRSGGSAIGAWGTLNDTFNQGPWCLLLRPPFPLRIEGISV